MRTLIKRAVMFAWCRGWIRAATVVMLFRKLRLANA